LQDISTTQVNTEADTALSDFFTSSAQLVDDIWDEVNTVGAHNVNNSTGKQLREGTAALAISSGTCQATGQTTTSVRLAASEDATDDIYNHKRIIFTGGTNDKFDAIIADYAGTGKDATIVPALPTPCDNTTTYEIVAAVVHAETQRPGYVNAEVYVDTVSGTAGTQLYVNGTADNPVASIADAKTIADALKLKIFHVEPGSSITLAASYDDYEFVGVDYTVALGGQSVSGTTFHGATITGNDDGSNAKNTYYDHCIMGENTLGVHTLQECRLSGDTNGITLAEAGTYFWEGCFSGVAGTGSPTVTFGAGNMNLGLRHWSGGIQIENMGASASTDTMSIEGWGQVIEGTCTGGTVAIRGNLTVSGITNLTLSDAARIDIVQVGDAVWDEAQAGHVAVGTFGEIATEIATLDTKINDVQGATFNTATDSLEAIRDRGDSAWITGGAGSNPATLQTTTIATLSSQTSFTLTAGSSDDDAYNGMLAVITDAVTSEQKCVGVIDDYTGNTKTVTLKSDPGVFTIVATDNISIIAVPNEWIALH
jgi:hypothetical protein